ncbi:hypothetical protein ACFLYU_00915 [Candidatus Dependentiae bacterium]
MLLKAKNSFFLLTLFFLMQIFAMKHNNTLKSKIGPFESNIHFLKKVTVSKEIIKKLNTGLSCNVKLNPNEVSRDLLLVSTKKNISYIFDIKNKKEIQNKKISYKQNESYYPFAIVQKDNAIYLKIKYSGSIEYFTFDQTISVNLLNNNEILIDSFKKQKDIIRSPYFALVNPNSTEKISHHDYKIKIKQHEIKIKHKIPNKIVKIKPKEGVIRDVFASPQHKSQHILVFTVTCPVYTETIDKLTLYDNQIGKPVKTAQSKPVEIYSMDPQCFTKNNKKRKFKYAIFAKKNNLLLLLFSSYVSILDLNTMTFIFKKKFKPSSKTKEIFLLSNEEEFGVSVDKEIYMYKIPRKEKRIFKKKLKKNTKYKDIKIVCEK